MTLTDLQWTMLVDAVVLATNSATRQTKSKTTNKLLAETYAKIANDFEELKVILLKEQQAAKITNKK